jgi:hypothetical protein
MLRLNLSLLALVPLLAVACGGPTHLRAAAVSDHDGRLFVDGAPLDYHREVSLQSELAGPMTIVLASPTATIDIVGGPGNTFELVVDLYTEFENDGGVTFENGVMSTSSDLEVPGAIMVNGIRGRLPEGVSLEVRTGTGDIVITSFLNQGRVHAVTGTGSVQVQSCELSHLDVDAGTGDVRLTDTSADSVVIRLGTGAMVSRTCDFNDFRGDSGTGDFVFHDSRLDGAHFDSGVGDVRLVDSIVSELSSRLGTGRVITKKTLAD